MPTYEYRCNSCNHRFEELQSMTADPISECIKCGGPVKRLIGAGAGIIFKGSGFYTTDYKKSSAATSSSEKSASTSSSEKKESGSEKKESGSSGSDTKSKNSSNPSKTDSGKSS